MEGLLVPSGPVIRRVKTILRVAIFDFALLPLSSLDR